ncbi:MAG: glycosyltransferase [Microbacterium sp.]
MKNNVESRQGDGRRVTIVSRLYRPEASAASLRLGALVDGLRTRGNEVRVLTTRPPKSLRAHGSRERGVSSWPVLRDRSGYVRGYLQYMSFDIPLFLRVLFGRRSDVFVCEPPPTTGVALRLAAALRRTPYVYYAADIWSDAAAATEASGAILRVLRGMERFAMRGAAVVLAVTDGVRTRVAELAPHADVQVVGHGVDLSRFAAAGASVGTPADIVYVGSASEWHGAELALDVLADVMSEDRTLTAAFIGQGSSWPALKSEARRRGLSARIRFFDTVGPEEAAAWLRSARVSLATLVPGQGYDFAVPTKLYASVAVGTPVVYAGPPAVGEVIEENRIGAAAPYEHAPFAHALRMALDAADGSPDRRLIDWAQQNLSAEEVARRAGDAIEAVSR